MPASVVIGFILYYLVQLPFWGVLLAIAPLWVLYLLGPLWARRSQLAFDRDLPTWLARGDGKALQQRYERAVGMRLFAPTAVDAERRGVVAREQGRHLEARQAFGLALHAHGGRAPLNVHLGYAHACHASGDDAAAIATYQALLDAGQRLPGIEKNLAHAMIRHGEAVRDAIALLDHAMEVARSDAERSELCLVRALAHAKLGERHEAERWMARAGTDPARTGTHSQLSGQVREVLGAVSLPRA